MSSQCADCTSQVQQKIAAKADDQNAEAEAKKYANEHNTPVAIYRDEQGKLCWIRADQADGYPVRGYISPYNLQDTD